MIPAAHLNDDLKRALSALDIKSARLPRVLHAPYLTHGGGVRVKRTDAAMLVGAFGLRVPFPVFRFCYRQKSEEVPYVGGCVETVDGGLAVCAIAYGRSRINHVVCKFRVDGQSVGGRLDFRARADSVFGLHSLKAIAEQHRSVMEEALRTLSAEVLILCFDYLAPHNFVARVRPPTQGKSVEWLRAREHYTIIHRHHAANRASVCAGSIVSNAGNEQRLAHSRRAHTKLLTHPRYTFKRGQRVFVRATWVGPQEWKDTAGQTYQILTQTAPDFVTVGADVQKDGIVMG